MTYNAGCWKRRLAVLVIATSWLTGCATVGFETGGFGTCAPVVEYSREVQVRAAEELSLLPDGSVVVEMMGDYAVMRNQARACARNYARRRILRATGQAAVPASHRNNSNHKTRGIDRQATAIIPTHKNGQLRKEDCRAATARNETLRATRHYGWAFWKRRTGYHARSRIEANMRHLKVFGDRIAARHPDSQTAEIQLHVALMNRFNALGTAEIIRRG